MDDRIKKFLDDLNSNLAGLPENEQKEALAYYEEYISDALDEGASPDELLSRLDTPEHIAAMVKAETSIKNVHNNPGLKNYSKLVKYARIGITRPLSILMFSVLIFATYSIAILLFLGTVVSAAAACIILPAFIYEALKIPAAYMGEIIGTIGIGIFSSGIFVLTAYGFYILCRPLIRLSAKLVFKMMKKSSIQINDTDEDKRDSAVSDSKSKPAVKPLRAGLIIIAAGLVISLATGLPIKLFMIFNSMKPAGITMHEQEFDVSSASRIRVNTAHSNIRLTEGVSDKIRLEYEESDWLDFDITCKDGELIFTEKSNGRLPLFPLVSMHENRAGLTISIPADYQPNGVSLESRGGFIHIESDDIPVDAKTYTGSISLSVSTDSESGRIPAAISAKTSTGAIKHTGKSIGVITRYGTEYEQLTESTISVSMESQRGDIFID